MSSDSSENTSKKEHKKKSKKEKKKKKATLDDNDDKEDEVEMRKIFSRSFCAISFLLFIIPFNRGFAAWAGLSCILLRYIYYYYIASRNTVIQHSQSPQNVFTACQIRSNS